MLERIEFYKNRSVGERFSVAIDFLKQNWKVLYKNILIGGFPLALISFFLSTQQANNAQTSSANLLLIFLINMLTIIISIAISIYLYSMSGAVLFHYDRNQLTEKTGWNDLKDTFFRFAGKYTVIFLLIFIPFVIVFTIILVFIFAFLGLLVGAGASGNPFFPIMAVLLIFGGFIAFSPSISMLYFPALFSGKGYLESIKISFSLGFKNWGSLFVSILLTGIALIALIIALIGIYLIFSLPLQYFSINIREANIISFAVTSFSAFGILLIQPIIIVIFAFQYFSIVEREEGVSLQSQMNEFENL